MNGKPVLYRRNVRTVLSHDKEEFYEKLLCDGLTLNLGDSCAYSCQFCYVAAMEVQLGGPLRAFNQAAAAVSEEHVPLKLRDVVTRRANAVEVLRTQLLDSKGRRRFAAGDNRVVFGSTLVDVAANMELLRETAEACRLILDHSDLQIRLLSKSNLLHRLFEDGLVPDAHRDRIILGYSTGTLDDRTAQAIESGTPRVSKRLESLRWLQKRGFRTYGMVCPSLPQEDYDSFSKEMVAALDLERLEHFWAEPINVRGGSLSRTLAALRGAGLESEAARLEEVSRDGAAWETYARGTFEAHVRHVAQSKLRYLMYVDRNNLSWWQQRIDDGAVLLGKAAQAVGVTMTALGRAPIAVPPCT